MMRNALAAGIQKYHPDKIAASFQKFMRASENNYRMGVYVKSFYTDIYFDAILSVILKISYELLKDSSYLIFETILELGF